MSLFNIALTIESTEDTILVIDDISFGVEQTVFENALVGLINLVLLKNGYMDYFETKLKIWTNTEP